ncbi:hypothetical protein DFH09DRAFT_1308425 [Mycena vulgaris]|nr:hypothetical protein DFH09DRAFT_1308425 [Mycena vulgaris]
MLDAWGFNGGGLPVRVVQQTRTLPHKVDARGCAKLLSPSLKEEGHAYTPTRTLCRRRHTRCEDKPAPPSNIRFPRTPSSRTTLSSPGALLPFISLAPARLRVRTASTAASAHEIEYQRRPRDGTLAHGLARMRPGTSPSSSARGSLCQRRPQLRTPRDTTPSPSAQDPSSKKARARDGSNARGGNSARRSWKTWCSSGGLRRQTPQCYLAGLAQARRARRRKGQRRGTTQDSAPDCMVPPRAVTITLLQIWRLLRRNKEAEERPQSMPPSSRMQSPQAKVASRVAVGVPQREVRAPLGPRWTSLEDALPMKTRHRFLGKPTLPARFRVNERRAQQLEDVYVSATSEQKAERREGVNERLWGARHRIGGAHSDE